MVDVGNTSNQADMTGFGSVDYDFSIGKFEVSIKQYAEYLNAVASIEDTYVLYDPQMGGNAQIAGIERSGNDTGYSYAVLDNSGPSGDRPITYINWFRAARFANWMSNGQPSGVKQDAASTENGAYDLQGADGNAVLLNAENPNTGAPPKFYITRENEWYKAAYYNPELNDGKGGYYKFGTANDTDPGGYTTLFRPVHSLMHSFSHSFIFQGTTWAPCPTRRTISRCPTGSYPRRRTPTSRLSTISPIEGPSRQVRARTVPLIWPGASGNGVIWKRSWDTGICVAAPGRVMLPISNHRIAKGSL
jgi:hypothetical protein